MTWMPFLCLGAGLLLGIRQLSGDALKIVDSIINVALIVLMLTIGMNIGINDSVMQNLETIGLNCIVISLSAVTFSVLFVILVERTILPLDILKEKLYLENLNINNEINIEKEEKKKASALIWIMPVSIIAGVVAGHFIIPKNQANILDYFLLCSLIFLYTGVGISLGTNRKVFDYMKTVGLKVVYISLAIFIGSLTGGLLSGYILDIPIHISVMSAGGMSAAFFGIIFCFFIEISQLYHSSWIDAIRRTTLGGLILGYGFLWSDLSAYFFGVCFGAALDGLKIRIFSKGVVGIYEK